MRQVCGLDVHKGSIFACILNENGVIFQENFGVLTTEIEKLAETLVHGRTVNRVGRDIIVSSLTGVINETVCFSPLRLLQTVGG